MKKAIVIIGIVVLLLSLLITRLCKGPAQINHEVGKPQEHVEAPVRLEESQQWPAPSNQAEMLQRASSGFLSPEIHVDREVPLEGLQNTELEPYAAEDEVPDEEEEFEEDEEDGHEWNTHDLLEAINSMDTSNDWSKDIKVLENLIEIREDLTLEGEMNAKLGIRNPPDLLERFAQLDHEEQKIIRELMAKPEIQHTFN